MRAFLFLLPLLLAAGALPAQSVSGRLSEEGSGRPIEGAVVVLLDEAGAQRGGTLTDAAGRFSLRAPAPGRYRLRAERIGFRSTLSPAFSLAPGEALERDLAASAEAIRLGGVEVEGERRCVVRPEEGMQAATLWEEARKALSAAVLTEEQRLVRFRVRLFERRLDPRFFRPTEEEIDYRTHVGSRPFRSLPAEDLAREGYVRQDGAGAVYYAPDAEVLLSDAFLDTHCFRVRRGEGETRGMVGLAFEPLRSHRLPDIEGVLWLDARSAELRFVEFHYTRGAFPVEEAQGGRVEYERLPGGAWIVRHWWIRMPLLGREAGGGHVELLGVKEAGGEAEEVVDGPGSGAVDRALLLGVVYDSTAAAPLAGATVYVSGTSDRAVTDATGFFQIASAREGEHTVGVIHPRLDSLGVTPTRTVSLVRGEAVSVELAVPASAAPPASLCGGPAPAGTGMLVGTVSDEETGITLPGAEVTLSWTHPGSGEGRQRIRLSDEQGRFRLCGAPLDAPVRMKARLLGRAGAEREVRLARGDSTVADLTLRLALRPAPDPERRTTFGPGAPAVVLGRVLDGAGSPVAGVVVRLEGTEIRETSDAEGRFTMVGVAADAYVLSARHGSGGAFRMAVELRAGDNVVEIRLEG